MRNVRLVAALLSILGMAISLATVQAAPVATRVTMGDFTFRPERITVRAGQTSIITLVNVSGKKKLHELMIGREVAKETGRPGGFEKDFFKTVSIKVSDAQGIWRLNEGEAKVSGEKRAEISGMAMAGHHGGFMVELKAGGTATLTFAVPADRVGEWEIGCFSEAGDHYVRGMKGKFVVVK